MRISHKLATEIIESIPNEYERICKQLDICSPQYLDDLRTSSSRYIEQLNGIAKLINDNSEFYRLIHIARQSINGINSFYTNQYLLFCNKSVIEFCMQEQANTIS